MQMLMNSDRRDLTVYVLWKEIILGQSCKSLKKLEFDTVI
jgi:hypothetical protein